MASQNPTQPKQDFLKYDPRWDAALHAMAEKHAKKLGLKILRFDPELYDEHRKDIAVVLGEVLSIEESDTYMSSTFPAYLQERDRLLEDETVMAYIDEIIGYLKENKTILVTVPHTEIMDLVFATLLISDLVSLRKKVGGVRMLTSFIFSKAIALLAFKQAEQLHQNQDSPIQKDREDTPIKKTVLHKLGQHAHFMFLTFPKTDNANNALKDAGVPDDEVSAFRTRFLRILAPFLRKGGIIIGIAPTGTTNNNTIDIQDGSEGILTHRNAIVIPVAFSSDPVHAVICAPSKFSSAEEIQVTLQEIRNQKHLTQL